MIKPMRTLGSLLAGMLCLLSHTGCDKGKREVDVLIIGGGASGVMAGIQAARMQTDAMIIEETPWLGGMLTAAGVSAIDGNNNLPAGLWGEFRDSLALHYGGRDSLETGWVSNTQFEPSVGNRILHNMTAAESRLTVRKTCRVDSVFKHESGWGVRLHSEEGAQTVYCKVLIDATELGDIARACGVGYDLGMESRTLTGESIAPENANHIVQDLTYVAILKDYGEPRMIDRPAGYDSTRFACACSNEICITPREPDRVWSPEMMITYGKLPNNKYMINWPIEGNDYYLNLVEMSPEEREEALREAKEYTLQFIYFIQNQLGMNTLSLADDEFPTEDGFPFIPYHRESRRIHGAVRFNLNDITHPYSQQQALYRTCIAVGDYPVDHHHTAYQGEEELPNLYFYPIPSYGLPVGCLIPENVEDLIVAEKSISVSNLVNGTTRLQPVVLQIGQAAGTMAALAVKQSKAVRDLNIRDIQNEILRSGGYLLPYLDCPKEDPAFAAYQRIGSTGILRGVGRNVEWKNQTWLRCDTVLLASELVGLKELYPDASIELAEAPLLVEECIALISEMAKTEFPDKAAAEIAKRTAEQYGFDLEPRREILRGQAALLIDAVLDPFNNKPVGLHGELLKN